MAVNLNNDVDLSDDTIADTAHCTLSTTTTILHLSHLNHDRCNRDWNVTSSFMAKNCVDPVRQMVELTQLTPNPDKSMISLSIGDPTTYGNLSAPTEARAALADAALSGKFDGYGNTTGLLCAQEAIANYSFPRASSKDVILTCGTCHALEMCVSVLCDRGDNILIPKPGYPFCRTIASSLGVECRSYRLQPDSNWEIDLDHLESLTDGRTKALVINNPSNPCGSVYSKAHLLNILQVAESLKLPIIADEIYNEMVLPGNRFFPLASLTNQVPILTCSGIGKRFICPGWRLGWIVIHDSRSIFQSEIRPGLISLSQKICGPSTIVQAALPKLLSTVPQSFHSATISTILKNAEIAFDGFRKSPGLIPNMPAGTIYMITGLELKHFPRIHDDLSFITQLVSEESVFCLPGKCFEYANSFRIVLTIPEDRMREAVARIGEFCDRHYAPS